MNYGWKRSDNWGDHRAGGSENSKREDRYDSVFWGLAIVLFGLYLLIPHATLPAGFWFLAIGCYLVIMNIVRFIFGLGFSFTNLFISIFLLIKGGEKLMNWDLPYLAILLILGGIYIFMSGFRK